jgi:O-antigen ligase
MIVSCILVFAIASLYQISMFEYYDRRVTSFVLFLSIFALIFVRLTAQQVYSFYIAVIAVSLYFSLKAIYGLFAGGLLSMAAEAKDEIGSQRIGFIYLVAMWALVTFYFKSIALFRWILLCGALIVAVGLILTFSRASIVALIGSIFFYLIFNAKGGGYRQRTVRLIYISALCSSFIFIIYWYVPAIYDFFDERLFAFIASGVVWDNIAASETSEGTRIAIWKEIFYFVMFNPITGSGFLGTWSVNPSYGSAHNQYFDTMLRLGLIGFAVYLWILLRIGKQLMTINMELFAGYSGILLYGLFHETFKEPAGALILSFLMSAYMNPRNQAVSEKCTIKDALI